MRISILTLLILLGTFTITDGQSFSFTIYPDSVTHQMKGGIGASWHVINGIGPLNNQNYLFPVREDNPLGSAWGGNPSVTDTLAWKQLCEHARWLGLDFIRVELAGKSYEPWKNVFTWDSDDMKALYIVLDYCQKNDIDVFLQQMCLNTGWNSYPGVHPLLSAPRSLDDYAEGISNMLEYLTKIRNYSCIKYFCITNEPPGGPWGYWWSEGTGDAPYTPAVKRVYEEFRKKNIPIRLSGPDWTSLPPFTPEKLDFAPFLGAYDIHSYQGIDKEGEKTIRQWADWAHSMNKPFFISEFGNMNLGWGKDNPGPKSVDAALSNANDIITALKSGTDAMNRWSFTNRGDMDGQWQLVQTYDRGKKEYMKTIVPENTAYYGFAMFTRFIAKYSSVLQSIESAPSDTAVSMISLKNPDGNIVIILLNRSNETKTGEIQLTSKLKSDKLAMYQYDENIPAEGKFELNPVEIIPVTDKLPLKLTKKSIVVLSSVILRNTDQGIIR